MRRLSERGPWRPIAAIARNRLLRRVGLAYAFFEAAEGGVWIAILVYAYAQGGATAAGLVAALQLAPAALVAPLAATFVDRLGPSRMLTAGYAAQAAALGATSAALATSCPPGVVYALATVASCTMTLTRPSQNALAPALARTQDELTAVNAVSGWIESASMLWGPAVAGVLLSAGGGPELVLAAMALAMAVSTLLVARVPAAPPPELERAGAADGARALAEHPGARLVVGLLAAQYLVFGALDVLFVVFAVDVLGLGQSGAGYLNSAFGAGGVIGVAATAALVGRARLVPALAAGMGAWCAACVVLALWPSALAAFVLLAVAGAGRNVFDVAGRTLLQRSAPPEVLGRVFGLLEGLAMAAMAVGALLTPVLIEAGGAGLALAATAALLPAIALLRPRRLAAVDRHADVPVVEVALLRRLAPMRALAAPDIERLARCLTPRRVGDGEVVIRQGDDADALYVVASGTLDVLVDGAPVNVLERGECFGEIGLLDDRPRTASVAARGEALVMALGRDDFLSAMAGSPRGAHEARQLADRRLAALDGVRANYEPCAPRPTSSAAD